MMPQAASRASSDSRQLSKLCVFCGSSDEVEVQYLTLAKEMGEAMVARDLVLVFGGGATGMMGALADAVLQAGGRVIGVTIDLFNNTKLTHAGLSELYVVGSMHARKARMIELSDGFVALPGGFGTLDEFIEVLTLAQIGLHQLPVGLLNHAGYYDHFLSLVEHARDQGFLYDTHGELILHDSDPDRLLDRMQAYVPPEGLERWLER